MSNFIETFELGQTGVNKGIPYGEGLESITKDTNGLHKRRIIGFAGAEKSGKTTLVDYATVISPYLHSLKNGTKISWIYYTYEIDRVSKEFDFMCFFLAKEYGVKEIQLPEGILKDGKPKIPLSPAYLKGQVMDDKENLITVNPELLDVLKDCYNKWILPLFGSWDKEGNLISPGLITIRDQADNPTGIYKDVLNFAKGRGKLKEVNKRLVSYTPNDSSEMVIVVIDHIRKLIPERGFNQKQTIDKMSEYLVILRNLLGYTFVPIIHTNRGLASVDRLATAKSHLYPTSDDLKDSGLENIILLFWKYYII